MDGRAARGRVTRRQLGHWHDSARRQKPLERLATSLVALARDNGFATDYADQNERDHAEFAAAVETGSIESVSGW
ncbi:MAG: hypothetical protein ACRDWD_08895 [Acidimicrobiia bacterium]